jgi:hypothetical protein
MKSRNILLVTFLLTMFLFQKRQAAPWASAARQLPAACLTLEEAK